MKIKTSVTLSEELLDSISAETDTANRSAFIEAAAWEYIEARRRAKRDMQETDLINAHADALNTEARETLEYQDEG